MPISLNFFMKYFSNGSFDFFNFFIPYRFYDILIIIFVLLPQLGHL